ncbi:MAG TPA: DUF5916 domain-containing protein [Vicinamibacteria bacterium]|nr:DUF5916 domain-containing protein [Vicinamibacteria bacterium]
MPLVEADRTPSPIHVDGKLDEEAWATAPIFADFTQRDPDEGAPATERTELHLLYDDDALYVGARLFDSEPERVVSRLSRRDERADADRFSIYLDPRHDRLTGVRFEVSAAGVQSDQIIYNDSWMDASWDAVWLSAVHRDENGWTVEMRIPFSELRFLPGDSQTWGVNASRYIQRKNETDWLALVPKTESGLASRMADLTGIRGVKPRTPLVLVPYASGGVTTGPAVAGDPFFDGTSASGSLGLDLRRKIGASFALDATLNPDFGQVEVDPAVVNLTAFETFFPEKRPFFVEGSQIFASFGRNGPNNYYGFMRSEPDLFYSRRIGRPPQGYVEADHVSAPTTTTILGAAKLTGKSASGWSVGLLEAVTGREYEQWADDAAWGRQEVEPLTNYLALRAFRDQSRAGYGLLFTAVNRDLGGSPLASTLAREAYVGGIDGYVYLDARKDWVVSGRLAGSDVAGSEAAVESLQLASARYYQRPDRPVLRLDPTRTSLSGWTGSVDLNRQSGRVRLNAAVWATSPGFESNDLGYNPRSDRWGGHAAMQLQEPEPDSLTRYRSLTVAKSWAYNFDGDKQGDALSVFGRARFRNYWNAGVSGSFRWRALDDRQTRGGPSMATAEGRSGGAWLESDDRKPVVGRVEAFHFSNEWGSRQWEADALAELRPSSALTLSVGPSFMKAHRVAQWVTSVADAALPSDLAGHYVFASFDQTEVGLTLRASWIFSPRLSLQLYAQPLVSRGAYAGFKELLRARSFEFLPYGPGQIAYDDASDTYTVDSGRGGSGPFTFANPDFDFKSLRLNTVLRWEWRPGSALFAVWTQGRESSLNPGRSDLGRDLDDLFASPSTNVFEVKATFRVGD